MQFKVQIDCKKIFSLAKDIQKSWKIFGKKYLKIVFLYGQIGYNKMGIFHPLLWQWHFPMTKNDDGCRQDWMTTSQSQRSANVWMTTTVPRNTIVPQAVLKCSAEKTNLTYFTV